VCLSGEVSEATQSKLPSRAFHSNHLVTERKTTNIPLRQLHQIASHPKRFLNLCKSFLKSLRKEMTSKIFSITRNAPASRQATKATCQGANAAALMGLKKTSHFTLENKAFCNHVHNAFRLRTLEAPSLPSTARSWKIFFRGKKLF
jgi:hypothetical protein